MSEVITLWHMSRAGADKIQRDGLTFENAKACVGGQDKGIYFFTKAAVARWWLEINPFSFLGEGTLCQAQIKKDTIRFPDWKLDLFFNQRLLSEMSVFLRRHFKNKTDKNGFVALHLPASYSGKYFCGCESYEGIITGLSFNQNGCGVHFNDVTGKTARVPLKSDMSSHFLGLADCLVSYLCENDKHFLTHYNKRLQKELTRRITIGAIKCVNRQPIPVQTQSCQSVEIPSLVCTGDLQMCVTDIYNRSRNMKHRFPFKYIYLKQRCF